MPTKPKRRSNVPSHPSVATADPSADATAATRGGELGWLTLIILGLALRVVVAAVSIGTNDAMIFRIFAHQIQGIGLVETYRRNTEFNHPPLAGLWAVAALKISDSFMDDAPVPPPEREAADIQALANFSFALKLPCLLADGLACCLVYWVWKRRDTTAAGLRAAAVYAWSVPAILITAFHGNTDTIFAVLSLLSVVLMSKGRAGLAGLALGAAINVKLIPVLLIPLLLLSCRTRGQALRLLASLAVCALPFVPIFLQIGPDFYRNALAYKSNIQRWGLMLPFTWLQDHPTTTDDPRLTAISNYGRYLLLVAVLAWSVLAMRVWRLPLTHAAAGVYALFLILASGFGVQYLVIVAPLLCAASLRWSLIYSGTAGLFLLLVYGAAGEWAFPLASILLGYFPRSAAIFGALAWLTLVLALVGWVRHRDRLSDHGLAEPAPSPQPV